MSVCYEWTTISKTKDKYKERDAQFKIVGYDKIWIRIQWLLIGVYTKYKLHLISATENQVCVHFKHDHFEEQ